MFFGENAGAIQNSNPRPTGLPQKTIRHSYGTLLKSELGFTDTHVRQWWHIARNSKSWANHVEKHLKLPAGTYTPYKERRYGTPPP